MKSTHLMFAGLILLLTMSPAFATCGSTTGETADLKPSLPSSQDLRVLSMAAQLRKQCRACDNALFTITDERWNSTTFPAFYGMKINLSEDEAYDGFVVGRWGGTRRSVDGVFVTCGGSVFTLKGFVISASGAICRCPSVDPRPNVMPTVRSGTKALKPQDLRHGA